MKYLALCALSIFSLSLNVQANSDGCSAEQLGTCFNNTLESGAELGKALGKKTLEVSKDVANKAADISQDVHDDVRASAKEGSSDFDELTQKAKHNSRNAWESFKSWLSPEERKNKADKPKVIEA